MALSIDHAIDRSDIVDVQKLHGDHPVYALWGYADQQFEKLELQLVIKQELVTAVGHPKESLRFNLNLMHWVDRDARIDVLTGHEVKEVLGFIKYRQVLAEAGGDPMTLDMQHLSMVLSGGRWVKMGFKDLTKLSVVARARRHGDKTGVREFARALKAPGGLEKLGEIIAVDLFNDNHDRCKVRGGRAYHGIRVQFLFNLGNVLLSAGQVSGLDSWDPNAKTRDLQQRLSIRDPDNEWGGYLLGPDAAVTIQTRTGPRRITKNAFAAGVIADLETVLGPRDRKFFLARTQRLPANAEMRLKHGMTHGARKIRQFLTGQALPDRLPEMLQDKVRALRWDRHWHW